MSIFWRMQNDVDAAVFVAVPVAVVAAVVVVVVVVCFLFTCQVVYHIQHVMSLCVTLQLTRLMPFKKRIHITAITEVNDGAEGRQVCHANKNWHRT